MSGAARSAPVFTVDQYLALERAATERHEFVDGVIYGMAGECDEHGDVTFNLNGILHRQLAGTPCRGRSKDTKVRSGPEPSVRTSSQGMYSYPDIVVICGPTEFHDEKRDIILNPTAIIEVLSPSTESFDRGDKFHRYQTWNPSLKDYVLVSIHEPKIEIFSRKAEGGWTYDVITGLDAELIMPSIGCRLPFREVYDRVFPG